jgi:hypothetical protein
MALHPVALGDLVAAARAGREPPWPAWPPSLVVAHLDAPVVDAPAVPAWWPAILIGVAEDADEDQHATFDVVVHGDDELAAIEEVAGAHPIAATALVTLLRRPAGTVTDGLLAESAVYSSLQAGPEFTAWRAAHPPRQRADDGERVRVDRDGGSLTITLVRPDVRNALDRRMRDELVEAFQLVEADPSIVDVHLRGEGPAFCAGGDLDEFGSRPDPATAHLVRVLQSAGRAIDVVADRVVAHVHGPCRGSGVELPAFAGQVLAAADTTFGLPEVSLGLIPGAGGTVSVPRRIGRHRTAWLALTGSAIDAPTALGWGLLDAIE